MSGSTRTAAFWAIWVRCPMTSSMPHSLGRRQLLRHGAIIIGAGGALSLLGEARAGAQPSPIQLGEPTNGLEFQPDFPTSPVDALPEPVRSHNNLKKAMRAAIDVAPKGTTHGFGAALVDVASGEILLAEKGGPGPGTNHAELNVMRTYGLMPADPKDPDGPRKDLKKTVLVTTAEPCPMCATCAIFADVAGTAYGTSLEFLMAHPPDRNPIRISMPQVVAAFRPHKPMPVVGGVLHEKTDPLFTGGT